MKAGLNCIQTTNSKDPIPSTQDLMDSDEAMVCSIQPITGGARHREIQTPMTSVSAAENASDGAQNKDVDGMCYFDHMHEFFT